MWFGAVLEVDTMLIVFDILMVSGALIVPYSVVGFQSCILRGDAVVEGNANVLLCSSSISVILSPLIHPRSLIKIND